MEVTRILLAWLDDGFADRHRVGVLELSRDVPGDAPPRIFDDLVIRRALDDGRLDCPCRTVCGFSFLANKFPCRIGGCCSPDAILRHLDLCGPENSIEHELAKRGIVQP